MKRTENSILWTYWMDCTSERTDVWQAGISKHHRSLSHLGLKTFQWALVQSCELEDKGCEGEQMTGGRVLKDWPFGNPGQAADPAVE